MTEPTQALVFRNLIEAVFERGLADRLTPQGKAQLKAAGVDLDRLLPAYPYEVWDRALIAGCSMFLGGKNVRVDIRAREAPSAVFRISWE